MAAHRIAVAAVLAGIVAIFAANLTRYHGSHAAFDAGTRRVALSPGSAAPQSVVQSRGVTTPEAVGLVGDSIMLAVSAQLVRTLHVTKVDAVVGRRSDDVLAVVSSWSAARTLQRTMVIDLGTNDEVTAPVLRSILGALAPCETVVVVNARAPRPWVRDNDSLLGAVVPHYANARLADWYAASANHPDYFLADGVHPNAMGLAAYARTIVAALGAPHVGRRESLNGK